MNLYEIAGQVIAVNVDSLYLHKNLHSFLCDMDKPIDLTFNVIDKSVAPIPDQKPIIHSSYMHVYRIENGYLIVYPDSGRVNACTYDEVIRTATIYITNSLTPSSLSETDISNGRTLNIIDYISLAIRDGFLLWMQKKELLAIHSSSLIYNEKAYLFSASSGTGKTTHTNMWVERFGVEILDGDITAVTIEDGIAVAYGLPWCGTSERFLNQRVPVGGIIFIAQSDYNHVNRISHFEEIMLITSRNLTPAWTDELMNANLTIAERIAPKILCCYFGCLPNQEAVDTIKDFIDSNQ